MCSPGYDWCHSVVTCSSRQAREKKNVFRVTDKWRWGLRFSRVWLRRILPSETWRRALRGGPFRLRLQISVTLHSIAFQKSVFFRPNCLILGSWKQETNIVNQTIPNMASQIQNSISFFYDSVNYFCVACFRHNLQIWLPLHVKKGRQIKTVLHTSKEVRKLPTTSTSVHQRQVLNNEVGNSEDNQAVFPHTHHLHMSHRSFVVSFCLINMIILSSLVNPPFLG